MPLFCLPSGDVLSNVDGKRERREMFTKAEMFSTREAPWMRLGELAEEPVTAGEAAQMGGMNFTVSKRPTSFMDSHGVWKTAPNRMAIVRDDNDQFIDTVGKGYEILQFNEAFDFMDSINPRYVAAGTLKGGNQGFLVVKPELEFAPAGDAHELFVILRTSHDRSRGVEVALMPLRGRCMNQLSLRSFTRGARSRWSIRHTKFMHERLDIAGDTIKRTFDYRNEYERIVKRLVDYEPSEVKARRLVENNVPGGGKRREEMVDSILYDWQENTETVGYNGTAWGLVNSVSEFMDWRTKGAKTNSESRFLSALNGASYRALNSMTRSCLELAV